MLDSIAGELHTLPFGLILLAALAWNVASFALCLVIGHVVAELRKAHRVADPAPPVTAVERWLAAGCVTINAVITVAGLALWRGGAIRLHAGTPLIVLRDTVVLLLAMDFAMYVLHRLAHHPLLFRLVHGVHHRYEDPRPLTLFVMHPLEVLGFGSLWLIVITLYQASAAGIAVYLTLNLAFGLMGHLGVEPLPAAWLRLPLLKYVSSSTFHAEHHQEREVNFGFYTLIWDRLFGTLAPDYAGDFARAASAVPRTPAAVRAVRS